MATDARSRTKSYLDAYLRNSQLTKDNDATQVGFVVMYSAPDYPLTEEFRSETPAIDLLYLIGSPTSKPEIQGDQTVYGYEERIPIETACIDKNGITGTKLRWKASAELRYVTETYPTGSQRALDEETPNEYDLGSTKSDKVCR